MWFLSKKLNNINFTVFFVVDYFIQQIIVENSTVQLCILFYINFVK